MLKELAQYIENRVDALTVGTNLFRGYRPENVPNYCVALLERTGELRDFMVSGKVDKPVQIVARDVDYSSARDLLDDVLGVLVGYGNAGATLPTITSGQVFSVNAATIISGPAWLGQDQQGRHEFVANIMLYAQLN